MAAGGHRSVKYEQHPSITSSTDEFTVRPRFVRKAELQQYTCGICKDILLQPHQTVCGTRVCKSCIDDKFEGKDVIPCPLPHEDQDEEELQEEECQQGGLRYAEHVVPDPGSQRFLLKEKCFCKNFDLGCREKPVWKRLKDHQAMCQFVPVHCPNPGCPEKYAPQNIDDHKARCGFMMVDCAFCKQLFRRKDMEEHINECEFADSQCTKCSERFDRRKQNAEFASYDGVLIWRISDYKRKKSDAVRGHQMSIYSYPFSTSRFGYKMCCRAYLNGDGLGRGKCLSLFFVVMRGEYDELLQFPFKQRVTFTLLCPSNPSQSKHETFMPDHDSSSCRRPQTEMNIASGCPQFALHSEVESSNFLVSDSIYIRIKVDARGELFM